MNPTDVEGNPIRVSDYVTYVESQLPGGYAEIGIKAGTVAQILPEGVQVHFTLSDELETVPERNLLTVDKTRYEEALSEARKNRE